MKDYFNDVFICYNCHWNIFDILNISPIILCGILVDDFATVSELSIKLGLKITEMCQWHRKS